MSSPFKPSSGVDGAVVAPSTVGFVAEKPKKQALPPQRPQTGAPAKRTEQAPAKPEAAPKVVAPPAKKGFFARLFGSKDQPAKNPAFTKSAGAAASKLPPLAKDSQPKSTTASAKPKQARVTETELVVRQHEDLIKSVDDICRSLESSQKQKVEVSMTDVLPPIPVENITALTESQGRVAKALAEVSQRLGEADQRDRMVMESLKQVDGTMVTLTKASDRVVTTMDGMKSVFSQVNGSMESVQVELKRSVKKYEELCEKVRKSDEEKTEMITKLQKRTLWITSLVGAGVIGSLIAVIAMVN